MNPSSSDAKAECENLTSEHSAHPRQAGGEDSNVQGLLRLLDLEIASIQDRAQASGWTAWALAGAFATTVWLFLGLWDQAPSLNAGTGMVFVLMYYGLRFCTFTLFWGFERFATRWRYALSSELRPSLPALCAQLLPESVALFVITWLKSSIPVWMFWTLFLIGLLRVLMPFIVILLSKTNLAIPVSGGREPVGFRWIWGTFLIGAFMFFTVIANTLNSMNLGTLYDLRLVSVGIASMEILRILAQRMSGTQPLDELLQIRRDLLLGETDQHRAQFLIKALLTGFPADEILQPHLDELLQKQMNIESYTGTIEKAVGILRSEVDTLSDVSDEVRSVLVTRMTGELNKILTELDQVTAETKEYERKIVYLRSHLQAIRTVTGGSDESLALVSARYIAPEVFRQKLSSIAKQVDELRKRGTSSRPRSASARDEAMEGET